MDAQIVQKCIRRLSTIISTTYTELTSLADSTYKMDNTYESFKKLIHPAISFLDSAAGTNAFHSTLLDIKVSTNPFHATLIAIVWRNFDAKEAIEKFWTAKKNSLWLEQQFKFHHILRSFYPGLSQHQTKFLRQCDALYLLCRALHLQYLSYDRMVIPWHSRRVPILTRPDPHYSIVATWNIGKNPVLKEQPMYKHLSHVRPN